MDLQPWQLGLLLKPLAAVMLLLCARYAAVAVLRALPEGLLKRILSLRW